MRKRGLGLQHELERMADFKEERKASKQNLSGGNRISGRVVNAKSFQEDLETLAFTLCLAEPEI